MNKFVYLKDITCVWFSILDGSVRRTKADIFVLDL